VELRLLVTREEKSIFGERLAEARARLGMRFRETPRSRHAQIQLAFANLYGLFGQEGERAGRMISGLAIHDLEMYPQSCPKPDLSHLPPRSVLECSDLWSLRAGAGLFAWCGMVVPVMRQRIRAVLVYLAVSPTDNAAFYRRAGFVNADQPILYPYAERMDGGEIRVQPMILQGEALTKLANTLSELVLGISDDGARIRLEGCLGLRHLRNRPLAPPSGGFNWLRPAEDDTRHEMYQSAAS
jgi:hypothetical protein